MIKRLFLFFTLWFLTPNLDAQTALLWSTATTTVLPGPGDVRLAEYVLPAPTEGLTSIRVSARLTASQGQAYLYVYGSTRRNSYLGYRKSKQVNLTAGTAADLRLEGLASADMDSVVVGLAFYGAGSATLEPPELEVVPVPFGTPDPEMARYVDEFFSYVRTNALDRDSMDWAILERDAEALVARADSMPDVYAALDFTLRRIDRHSYLQSPKKHKGWATGNNDEDTIDPNLKYPTGRRVSAQMVYFELPELYSGHDKTLKAYADSLQHLIARLDGPDVDEWIVDLRDNGGGNCWPMLAGLGPLLGEGACGYFMQRDGSDAKAWSYWNGGSYLDGKLLHDVDSSYRVNNPPRVALLYGPKTASSAEVVAVAFRGLPNTRSFGRPTSGYSTGNRTYKLTDGAAVLLTVSVYGDRLKQAYGEEIPPDVIVPPTQGVDAAAEAAATWLRAGR